MVAVVKVATVLLVVVTALAVGCSIQSATILSWYTVASGTVAVVVRVATVLLSGCNSSCSSCSIHSATVLAGTQLLVAW